MLKSFPDRFLLCECRRAWTGRDVDGPLFLVQVHALPDLIVARKLVPSPGDEGDLGKVVHVDKVQDVGGDFIRKLGEEVYVGSTEDDVKMLVDEQLPLFWRWVCWLKATAKKRIQRDLAHLCYKERLWGRGCRGQRWGAHSRCCGLSNLS